MDGPPPIIIGLEGLIQHALPRITRFRSAAAATTNFGRLSPFLKRLQVSILLLGSIYRKFSQYDMIAGSDLCLGICHDSLVQTQGMMQAVLQAPDGDNVYSLGAEMLIERLPDEISSFISSVELLRSTYQESQSEYILGSMKELANLRKDYSNLQEHLATMTPSSEDEPTTPSNGTQLTEPEVSFTKSPAQRSIQVKLAPSRNSAASVKGKLGHTAVSGAQARLNRGGREAKKNKGA